MIQRIQTIFLLLGVLLLGADYALDEIWRGPAALDSDWFTPVTLGLFSLALTGAVLSIFMYKNLARQKQAIFVVFLIALFGVIALDVGLFMAKMLPGVSGGPASTQVWLAVIFPVGSLLFFFLARRNVKQDMKILKSVDRLR